MVYRLFAMILVAVGCAAQNVTVTGKVTGPDGETYLATFVALKNTATGQTLNAAGEGGVYKFDAVAPGAYDFSVIVPGMKNYERKGIVLSAGQILTLNATVEHGASLGTLGEDPDSIALNFIFRDPPPDGPTPRTADGHPDLSGLWLGPPVSPEGLEMLPWAAALAAERRDNHGKDWPPTYCLPAGPAALMGAGLFEIVQAPHRLVMLFEGETPGHRLVYLDGRERPKEFGPSWLGYSVGRWEGETLVIETSGFHDRGWLSFEGAPHSAQLRVTQRIRRPNLGALEIEITVDDPGAYRKPWSVTKSASLAADETLMESICNENNRDVAHMVGK